MCRDTRQIDRKIETGGDPNDLAFVSSETGHTLILLRLEGVWFLGKTWSPSTLSFRLFLIY